MARFLNRRALVTPLFVLTAALGAYAGQGTQTPPAKPSPATEFNTTLRQPGGAAKARQMYDQLKKKDPAIVLFGENEMNLYGYELLQDGNPKDAVIVFQMNVDAYPKSSNVYDSLSDGLLAAGDKAGALKNAEKSLLLVDKDTTIQDEETRAKIRASAAQKVKDLKPPV